MSETNRREDYRIPLQIFLTEVIAERPYRCISANLSAQGIYLRRLVEPAPRVSPVVGLEFELPGTGEVIWASGKASRESNDPYFHGTGIRFAAMARRHERLIHDWVREERIRHLEKLLATIRRNRMQ